MDKLNETSGWLRAVDEALVVHHIGVANVDDDYETAREKLNKLLCVSQDIEEYFAKQKLVAICKEALASYRRWHTGVRGQQMRPEDSLDWHVAREVERAHGIGEKHD